MTNEERKALVRVDWLINPCPFCGIDNAHVNITHRDGDTTVSVECRDCGANIGRWVSVYDENPVAEIEAAIAAWNRRAEYEYDVWR